MTTPAKDDERWVTAWDDVRETQRHAIASCTHLQRLRWLEEMIVVAHASGAFPRKRNASGRTAR